MHLFSDSDRMIVLHITVHMGGGIGRALSDIVVATSSDISHHVILLEQPEKVLFIDKCRDNLKSLIISPNYDEIENAIRMSDIVILHWWHHPKMCEFLYKFPKIKARIILWSHVNGCVYPYISEGFLECFSGIFITSEYSLENPTFKNKDPFLVYGLGRLDKFSCKDDYKFKQGVPMVGYSGTLLKSKLHPDFVRICKLIIEKRPVNFVLAGDKEDAGWIEEEAEKCGISDKIKLTGFVSDISTFFDYIDLYMYPLNPRHFATTENSLLEAMASGQCTVAFNQGTEKYIINNEEDGMLASDIFNMAEITLKLLEDENLRSGLGKRARNSVIDKFSFDDNVERFLYGINSIMDTSDRLINFKSVLGESPYDWFLSAVNQEDKNIIADRRYEDIDYIFYERTKGSVLHFSRVFPDDYRLKQLCEEMRIWNYKSLP